MNQPVSHRGALPPGTRVQEFEFQQVLGHGGFGITYQGRNTVLQTTVAIKEYMPSGTAIRDSDQSIHPKTRADEKDYEWGLDRFLDEARMLARFDHPGIVRVQQFFEAHGTAYIAMEYLEGRTLGALYHDEKVLDELRLRALLMPILEALEQVHSAEFLHRDLKPGNIMVRSDGRPVLIDFGAARAAIAMRSQNVTAIVTPGFSPIEQYSTSIEGNQGPWTDIYAIGAVLYRGMTGMAPSDATARTMDDRLVPAHMATAGKYSKPLTDAVDWALRMRGAERPQSISEWRETIEEGRPPRHPSAGLSTTAGATEPETVRTIARPSGKTPWLVATGLAAVLAVGGVAYWWDEQKASGPTPAELARIEAEARAAEVQRLTEECAGHGQAKRLAAELTCYRGILALEPDHEKAAAEVRRLRPLVAWKEVAEKHTVDGYYGFEQEHAGSKFARLARHRLEQLEEAYWKAVHEAGTPEAYRRYLEIYPEGRFATLAKRQGTREE